jgi:6-phosphogluconolactonase
VTGKRPVSVAVDPTGSFLFVSDYAYTKISVESIGSNGALTPVTGSPFRDTAGRPGGIAVDPTAKFVYVVNDSNTVSGYSIGADGKITPVPNSPFCNGECSF